MNAPDLLKQMLAVPAKSRDDLIFEFSALGRQFQTETRRQARRKPQSESFDTENLIVRPVRYRMKVQP